MQHLHRRETGGLGRLGGVAKRKPCRVGPPCAAFARAGAQSPSAVADEHVTAPRAEHVHQLEARKSSVGGQPSNVVFTVKEHVPLAEELVTKSSSGLAKGGVARETGN